MVETDSSLRSNGMIDGANRPREIRLKRERLARKIAPGAAGAKLVKRRKIRPGLVAGLWRPSAIERGRTRAARRRKVQRGEGHTQTAAAFRCRRLCNWIRTLFRGRPKVSLSSPPVQFGETLPPSQALPGKRRRLSRAATAATSTTT